MTISLKAEILEKLHLKKGEKNASLNIRKASHDFEKSNAPQFRGKDKKKRHQMAVAAGLSAARGESAVPQQGDKMIYEGKQVVVQQINERSQMAVIKLPKTRDLKIVRVRDLQATQTLNEGVLGMSAIGPTYRDTSPSQFIHTDLSLEDIGFEIVRLREDEFTGDDDEQEDVADNGSNIRYDGHTGKKEVDELPTPSDTIATAYSDQKPPKQLGKPLSTEPGHTVAKDPDLHAYDFPADAPEIPEPDFQGADAGNSRAPTWGEIHEPGKNQEQHEDSEPDEERTDESFNFILEMDDLLGADHHEHREPRSSDHIKVSLPAMASILCTVAKRVGPNHTLLKSIIEALSEVGRGAPIEVSDLSAVASHMNGEETQEVKNRASGRPEHEGIPGPDHHHHGDNDHQDDHDDHHHEPHDTWPGDGEKSGSGKTKLLSGFSESEEEVDECDDEEMAESYYSWDDMVAEHRRPTPEEELRDIKRRAGLKYW